MTGSPLDVASKEVEGGGEYTGEKVNWPLTRVFIPTLSFKVKYNKLIVLKKKDTMLRSSMLFSLNV